MLVASCSSILKSFYSAAPMGCCGKRVAIRVLPKEKFIRAYGRCVNPARERRTLRMPRYLRI